MGTPMTRPKNTLKLAMYLTGALRSIRSQRAPKAGSSRVRLVLWGILLSSALGVGHASAQEITKEDLYKLYAHSRIVDFKQFNCFVSLIEKENSTWNVKARNGSHYGIGQMKNERYRRLDGFTQIDWSLRYITKRYQTPCKAWTFFKAHRYH